MAENDSESEAKLRIRKAQAKTNYTKERRSLLVATEEENVSKYELKTSLLRLESWLAEVMDIVALLAELSDDKGLAGLCSEAEELERSYAEAVNRASEILSYMSEYNSTATSETGLRYSRDPEKIQNYFRSMPRYKQVQNLHDQRKEIEETEVDGVAHRKSVVGVTSGEVARTTSTARTFGESAEATVRRESSASASETEMSRPVTATRVCVDQPALSAPQAQAQYRPTTSQLANGVSARVKSEAVPVHVAGQFAQESSPASYLTGCQAQVNTTTQTYTQMAVSSQDVASVITSTNPSVTSTGFGKASMSYRYSTSVPGQLPSRGVNSTGLGFTQHSLSVAQTAAQLPYRYMYSHAAGTVQRTQHLQPPTQQPTIQPTQIQQPPTWFTQTQQPPMWFTQTQQPTTQPTQTQQPPMWFTQTQQPPTQLPQIPTTVPSDVYRHLKKIQIPTFSGEKQAYNTWRTAFNVCVDQQPISPELKLLQLRQYLSGPPLETVETYGYSASAYTTALKRLDQKYGGERRKTAVHMMALSNLPAIREKGTAAELERFADLLQIAIINFEDAGRRDELMCGTFCTQMQQKLSATLLTDYFRWRSDHREPETVQTLLAWLTQEADFRTVAEETLQHSDGKDPRPTPVKNTQLQQSSRHSTQPTASSLTVSSANAPQCEFCGRMHEAKVCTVIKEVGRRKEVLKDNGRCYVCLQKNHIARGCLSKIRCQHCGRRHHTSICEANKSSPRREKSTSSNTVSVNGSGGALLQIAQASVASTTDGSCSATVRILLDGGSQRSYITQRLQDQLQVSATSRELLSINAFGRAESAVCKEYDCVTINIFMTDGSTLPVSTLSVPSTCPPVHNQVSGDLPVLHESISGLDLADNCNSSASIDVLLGADVYWKVVTGEVRRADNGPVAIATRLGWVLSGPTTVAQDSSNVTSAQCVQSCVNKLPAPLSDSDGNQLTQQSREFWERESLGIAAQEPSILEKFSDSNQNDGQRYVVGFPWREHHPNLPDNHQLYRQRLQATLRKLKKMPAVREYDAIVRQQLEMDIVEVVSDVESTENGVIHNLPHQPSHPKLTAPVNGEDCSKSAQAPQASSDTVEGSDSYAKTTLTGASSRIVDLLGYLSTITIPLNVFHQHLCKSGLGWDDLLQAFVFEYWQYGFL